MSSSPSAEGDSAMSDSQTSAKNKKGWRRNYFAWCEVMGQQRIIGFPIAIIALLFALLLPALNKASALLSQPVVVYTSQDQVYAEPILQQFTRETGIKVRAVYDSEAVKTVGLANRLLAERSNPQCDVFWNNEELRTRQLAARNVFRETNAWAALGFRSRRIVINTNQLASSNAPRTFAELTNSTWRGRIALAYPLFGTTATHFLALRQHWGANNWQSWCRALQANKPFLVDGNSVVVNLVGRGEAWIGLTDSDDIAAGQREGLPIAALPFSEESLLIPNTVGVVRGARHPVESQKLFEYLQRPEVVEKLVAVKALEGKSREEVTLRTLQVDWPKLLHDLDEATAVLKAIFLRR
jgi:iron(III) transport system substrate-binding protein